MIYAQISAGRKMHLAFEPGEEHPDHGIVLAGHLSVPLCNQPMPKGGYRMSCNLSLGHACKKCRARWRSLREKR